MHVVCNSCVSVGKGIHPAAPKTKSQDYSMDSEAAPADKKAKKKSVKDHSVLTAVTTDVAPNMNEDDSVTVAAKAKFKTQPKTKIKTKTNTSTKSKNKIKAKKKAKIEAATTMEDIVNDVAASALKPNITKGDSETVTVTNVTSNATNVTSNATNATSNATQEAAEIK
jgi:hypothetical protein